MSGIRGGASMQDILNTKGMLSEIQHYSVHDGPGIRTLVFLKGCPLRCRWCCNPENQSPRSEIMIDRGKPKLVGKKVSAGHILGEALKDNAYYRRSGGGVTLSGGEALMQPEFTLAILKACKAKGIHTAIETTAFAKYDIIHEMLPYLDLVMCDIKHIVEEKHRAFTSQSNRRILENIVRMGESGANLIVRVPVIPTFNATEAEILMIAFLAAQIQGVRELHLLPYHRLGESKYQGLGREYDFSSQQPLSYEDMKKLKEAAQKSGLKCQIGG